MRIKCSDCLEEIVKKLKVLTLKSEEQKRDIKRRAKAKRYGDNKQYVFEIKNNFSLFMEQTVKKRELPKLQTGDLPTSKLTRATVSPIKEVRFGNFN
jgi:hypothetical protein